MPSTFVVNSIYDQPAVDPSAGAETATGTITLRSAIQAANSHPNDASGPDRIEFNIPGDDVHMIAPFSLWPAITDPIVIDGYSQPGAKPNTLDSRRRRRREDQPLRHGSASGDGLTINAGNSTVRGLDFTNFSTHGLRLTDKGGNVVQGNFFGFPASGEPSIGNGTALYVALRSRRKHDRRDVSGGPQRDLGKRGRPEDRGQLQQRRPGQLLRPRHLP